MARSPVDRHYTPPGLFEALVPLLGIGPGDTVLLCSMGHGAALEALQAAGADVYGVDIDPDAGGFKRLSAARSVLGDFVEWETVRPDSWPRRFDWVLDNPPFSLLDDFVRVAIRHARRVAFVVRSTWWEARYRVDELAQLGAPRLLMPSPRPSYRLTGGGTDSAPTFFVVWDQTPRSTPTLETVTWKRVRGSTRPLIGAVRAAVETPWWRSAPSAQLPTAGTQLALLEEPAA